MTQVEAIKIRMEGLDIGFGYADAAETFVGPTNARLRQFFDTSRATRCEKIMFIPPFGLTRIELDFRVG